MELLIARLTERAQKASMQSLPTTPVSVVEEDKPLVSVETRTNASADEEELSNLMIGILSGHQAIPLRVKIILDNLLDVLGYGKVELIFLNSQWTREEYNRGYKVKYPEFLSNSVSIVCEQETVDRLDAFIRKSSFVQSVFPHGFAPPIFRVEDAMPILTPVATEKANSEVPVPLEVLPEGPEVNGLDLLAQLGMAIKTEVREDTAGSVADNLAYIMKHTRRVSCDDCGKDFCDKGALKTHRNAVHLRQMHSCTVPGCGKQFNSTRSRDRHSSNPNQKLHTPDPASFRHSLINPPQVIATRLFPPASPSDCLSPTVKTEVVDSAGETIEQKPNVSILKRRLSKAAERTDIKRSPVTGESGPTTNGPDVAHLPNMDLQMILFQQLIHDQMMASAMNQNSPTHPSFA